MKDNQFRDYEMEKIKLEIEKLRETPKKQSWIARYKDYLDLVLRFIATAAIGIPVMLFFFQQRAEMNKQKYLLEIDTYSKLDVELHTFMSKIDNPVEFEKSKNRLLYELLPKCILLNNQEINDTLNFIKKRIVLFYDFHQYAVACDSFAMMIDKKFDEDFKHRLNKSYYKKAAYYYNEYATSSINFEQNLHDSLFLYDSLRGNTAMMYLKIQLVIPQFLEKSLATDKMGILRRRFEEIGNCYDRSEKIMRRFMSQFEHTLDHIDSMFIKHNKIFQS